MHYEKKKKTFPCMLCVQPWVLIHFIFDALLYFLFQYFGILLRPDEGKVLKYIF